MIKETTADVKSIYPEVKEVKKLAKAKGGKMSGKDKIPTGKCK